MWAYLRRSAREMRHRTALRKWNKRDRAAAELFSEFVRSGSLVFDVGANYGHRAKVFLHLGARVVAFEPQPECARFLDRMFGGHCAFQLVNQGLGPVAGPKTLHTGTSHVLASFSSAWIAAVKHSGRFKQHEWSGSAEVELLTLDQAIQKFGQPAFVKIDVEGFEAEVLEGLSQPLSALSLEVMPEFLANTLRCIDQLEQLGEYEYRLSLAESFVFCTEWLSAPRIMDSFGTLDSARERFGDLYARLRQTSAGG